jgi:hypothetical protein
VSGSLSLDGKVAVVLSDTEITAYRLNDLLPRAAVAAIPPPNPSDRPKPPKRPRQRRASLQLGVGGAPTTEGTRDSPAPESQRGWGAYYSVAAQYLEDECGSGVYWAAKHVRLDVENGTLWADVVDRWYTVRVVGGELVVESTFANPALCPGRSGHERWVLRRQGDALVGTAMSDWYLPPSCNHCVVKFSVVMTPAQEH